MTLSAEKLFDELGQQYEESYVNNSGLEDAIDCALKELSPKSQVLDVGCGTGKPVATRVARAGHKIHGIDISQEMVNIASRQVIGRFEKADMTTFQPSMQYDAIFTIFSMFQLSHSQTYSMMFKYSEWLETGGLLVLGTIPSTSLVDDESLYDASGKIVRHADLLFMGRRFLGTVYTKDGWRDLFRAAGFEIQLERSFVFNAKPPYDKEVQDHYLIIAKKVVDHALMGPYPLPTSYRGPHPLSEAAWAPFSERLVRDEFNAVLEVIKGNKKVLDVGSGYGMQIQEAQAQGVTICSGSAEKIPFCDRTFDAAVAMWVLHYVDDLDKSLREIARVVDPSSPNSRIVIVQGAPDNELVNLLNDVCAPLSAQNTAIDHQGYLLSAAATVFAEYGFGDVEVFRVNAYCAFPEEDLTERCQKAAEVLAAFWFRDDSNFVQMKEALIPHLKLHFRDRPYAINDEVAVLVAKPLPN
ncbi:demethylmenaquinone methyltransferase [Aspergillus udagawae]|uniref:Demethylmenaquinone methyltransferase n=1 Tax=Aspergillus udagawae TaxID=91492 RepID=A0ABQ1B7T1_9EURO|nr:demethylmenaquinone methyltransferase [Aspergillus udagawae]